MRRAEIQIQSPTRPQAADNGPGLLLDDIIHEQAVEGVGLDVGEMDDGFFTISRRSAMLKRDSCFHFWRWPTTRSNSLAAAGSRPNGRWSAGRNCRIDHGSHAGGWHFLSPLTSRKSAGRQPALDTASGAVPPCGTDQGANRYERFDWPICLRTLKRRERRAPTALQSGQCQGAPGSAGGGSARALRKCGRRCDAFDGDGGQFDAGGGQRGVQAQQMGVVVSLMMMRRCRKRPPSGWPDSLAAEGGVGFLFAGAHQTDDHRAGVDAGAHCRARRGGLGGRPAARRSRFRLAAAFSRGAWFRA